MLDMPEGSLRLAVTHLGGPGGGSPALWPGGLDEGCGNLDLIRGDVPDSLPFSPEGWVTLRAAH
jgi:hypothetical protein